MFFSNLNKKSLFEVMNTKQYEIKNRTFDFALSCLKLSKLIAEEQREFIITKQLTRSATSIGANVRESRNAVSKRDFINKLAIAQKECDETLYWLELLSAFLEKDYPDLNKNKDEAEQLLRILSSIIINTKRNEN